MRLAGNAADPDPDEGKDHAAIERGRLGGLKGGRSRAASLTPAERTAAAKKAVFTDDLQERLANRVQITSDGHKAYLEAIATSFGGESITLC